MSRPLPADCNNIVLSYLPIGHFSRLSLPVEAWKIRFYLRYGEVLQTDIKKQNLIRDATEYREVIPATLEYCSPTIAYYHAAVGGNWGLLNHAVENFTSNYMSPADVITILGDFAGEIFLMACRQNQVRFVQKTITNLLQLINSNEDYIWTTEIYQIFKAYSGSATHKCLNQVLAFAPISEFTQMIEKYSNNNDRIRQIMLHIGKYNKHDPNHWAQTLAKLKICAPYGYSSDLALYLNNYITDNEYIQYNIITSFNTANLGDWLLEYDISFDTTTYGEMKNHYQSIPNMDTRARETIDILTRYVSRNDILQLYIIASKILLKTITVEDIPVNLAFSLSIVDSFMDDLLDERLFHIIDKLIDIGFRGYMLMNYIFKDIETLKYMLLTDDIFIGDNCTIGEILTLPLITEIEELAQEDEVNEENYDIIQDQIHNYITV